MPTSEMPARSDRRPEPFMAFDETSDARLVGRLHDRRDGKVRVSFALDDGHRVFVTTDRLSAFDRILGGVAYKGQVLNELAAFWFEQTADIVANHLVARPDPNAIVALAARPLPVEVIVRAAITGVTDTSLWQRYAAGQRVIDGHRLPDGLAKNAMLPSPIVTPTTKAAAGGHDEPLSPADVVARSLVETALWDDVQAAALALFARGQQVGESAGLTLADTKYEFGLGPAGELLLIDEVHTPDSSRWWVTSSLDERRAAGDEPESLDKEVVRRVYADLGYRGHGEPPVVEDSVWARTSERYIDAFERLTGSPFARGSYPVAERLADRLAHWLAVDRWLAAGDPPLLSSPTTKDVP